MGKIKGWLLSSKYDGKRTPNKLYVQISSRPYKDHGIATHYLKIDRVGNSPKWFVSVVKDGEQIVARGDFTSMLSAQKYALDYMRRNP